MTKKDEKLKKSNKLSERADVVFLQELPKAMKDIADNQIDLTHFPPYNINKEYEDKIDFKECSKGIETQ